MTERRVASPVLALTGAALIVVSLFLDWYRVDPRDSQSIDFSGWNAFETIDLLLMGAALAALLVVGRSRREANATSGRTLALVGAITALVIVIQLIDKPPLIGFPEAGFDVTLRIGAWMALAGALLVLVAGALRGPGRSGSRESGGL